MADSSSKKSAAWNAKNDPDGLTRAEVVGKDWALDILLRLTSELAVGNSIGISIVVNGMLISGQAIHPAAWRDLIVEQMRGAGGKGDPSALADAIERIYVQREDLIAQSRTRREEQDAPQAARQFLHLKGARLYTPGSVTDYPTFRVATIDISGWSLGSHSAG